MPRCPVCRVNLERIEYENLPIWGCPDCGGHSLSKSRLEGIKRSTATPPEALGDEAREYRTSTGERLRCPDCLGTMRKEIVKGKLVVEIDRCESCEHVWLDAGELAMLQLAHEASEQGRESAELRRRLDDLHADPDRRERFEKNVANLPKSTGTALGDIVGEIFGEDDEFRW